MNQFHYIDPDFGSVTWRSHSSEWVGRLAVGDGKAADFSIQAEPRYMEVSEAARAAFLHIRRSDQAARQFACAKLLSLYNDSWREGEPISAVQFTERLRLEGFDIDAEGNGTLYYFTDELFSDHSIQIGMSPEREFTSADLCG